MIRKIIMTESEMNYSIDKDPNRLLTIILYILYIVAIFSAGLLAVLALIINYVKRSDVAARFLKAILLGRFVRFGGISFGTSLLSCLLFFCSLLAIMLMLLQV
jgi:hypothetical protein